MNTLEKAILENKFVTKAKTEMKFDKYEYTALCILLDELSNTLLEGNSVSKKMALTLYKLPTVIRDIFLSLNYSSEALPETAYKFEDAWQELDMLVVKVLGGSNRHSRA